MPAGCSITNEERKKFAVRKTYRRHSRNAVFSYEEARKANQAIHRDDISRLKCETYIGRPVLIRTKTYDSDGIRATGMTGIDEKKAHVCSMYRDFFNFIMTRGGYQTSIRWADMLCHHADYDIAFER